MNHIKLTASNVLMWYLIFVRMAHIFILVALRSKVYVSGRLIAGSNPAQSVDVLFLHSLYEGWNFNSGNYLFTTDTK